VDVKIKEKKKKEDKKQQKKGKRKRNKRETKNVCLYLFQGSLYDETTKE
jgi:hypothetical protein